MSFLFLQILVMLHMFSAFLLLTLKIICKVLLIFFFSCFAFFFNLLLILLGGEFHVRGMSLQVEPLYPNKSKKPTTNNTTPTQNNINALNMNRNLNINNSHSSIHLNNNITVKNTSNPIAPPPPNKSSFLVLWLFFVSKEGRAGEYFLLFFLFLFFSLVLFSISLINKSSNLLVAAQTPINPLKWPLNDSSVSNQQQ